MSTGSPRGGTEHGGVWLRRLDQACVAGLMALGLALLAGHWLAQGALQGRLLEFAAPALPLPPYSVDVNHAERDELMLLPGVGETLAQRIIDVRTKGGLFRTVDDLRRVRGIGPRSLERLRPLVRVEATRERPDE